MEYLMISGLVVVGFIGVIILRDNAIHKNRSWTKQVIVFIATLLLSVVMAIFWPSVLNQLSTSCAIGIVALLLGSTINSPPIKQKEETPPIAVCRHEAAHLISLALHSERPQNIRIFVMCYGEKKWHGEVVWYIKPSNEKHNQDLLSSVAGIIYENWRYGFVFTDAIIDMEHIEWLMRKELLFGCETKIFASPRTDMEMEWNRRHLNMRLESLKPELHELFRLNSFLIDEIANLLQKERHLSGIVVEDFLNRVQIPQPLQYVI